MAIFAARNATKNGTFGRKPAVLFTTKKLLTPQIKQKMVEK
jgi:hypothetical protein